jgi:hypothetical protein
VENIVSRLDSTYLALESRRALEGNLPTEAYRGQADLERVLAETASDGDLLELTRHSNPYLRSESIRILGSRNAKVLFSVISERTCDTANTVVSSSRCEVIGGSIADLAFFEAQGILSSIEDTVSQRFFARVLDSLAIFSKCNFHWRSVFFACNTPDPSWYAQVRQLVERDHYGPAYAVLAHFRNDFDVELLLDTSKINLLFNKARSSFVIDAAKVYHHQQLFAFLCELLEMATKSDSCNEGMSSVYDAIASYKDSSAVSQLAKVTQKLRTNNCYEALLSLGQAMANNYSPLYDSLQLIVWSETGFATPATIKRLARKFPIESLEYSKKGLYKLDELPFLFDFALLEEGEDYDPCNPTGVTYSTDSICATFLDLVKLCDSAWFSSHIFEQIDTVSLPEFEVYADRASRYLGSLVIPNLLGRFSNDGYGEVSVVAARSLLKFQDKKLNRELMRIRIRRPHLMLGWTGAKLDILFKEYGIY